MDREKDIRVPETPENATESWRPEPDEVARLAYLYYEQRGSEHGLHDDDWYRAEQELHRRRSARSGTAPSSTPTVIAVFPSLKDAQRAVDDLLSEGYSGDEISLVARQSDEADLPDTKASEVAADAGIGAAVGGVGGLLLGLTGLAIPGIGLVLAAGPIIAALGGAGLGAAAGGLIGALTERGVPSDVAGHYSESVRRGGVMVTVNASGNRADRAAEIMNRNGAADIDESVNQWRSRGWTGFDPDAKPLAEAEVRREREYLQSEKKQAEEWSRESRTVGAAATEPPISRE